MLAIKQPSVISVEDYLAGEEDGEIRHELIDGEVFAMTGGTKNHGALIGMFQGFIMNHLLIHNPDNKCRVYPTDLKVKVNNNFFYPDIVVTCEKNPKEHRTYTEEPLVIIEVLSKSTRRIDQTIKLQQYTSLPSLQEYILVEQDIAEIKVIRRNQHWQAEFYYLGDQLILESIGISMDVADIYQWVENQDVYEYQAKLAEENNSEP